ncbi:hypothetical protein WR25_17172 isoform C [Diploscapter pachys]|uniref:ACB domain-containing protein n=1 Tax=Diploscapter pachys TaxID=2018661 RepID=A0A2A2LDD6_9BILA|nr:hypothetical protein WR25_17172 isoform C [Diploscapter pachys]
MELFEKKRLQADQQKIRWEKWQMDKREAEQRAKEFAAYWRRRHEEDKDLWRDKDFANANDKMSRAGYKGKHGNLEIPGLGKSKKKKVKTSFQKTNASSKKHFTCKLPSEIMVAFFSIEDILFISDGNKQIRCAREWEKLMGMTRINAQRLFIKNANKLLTRYGWNPPEGWY